VIGRVLADAAPAPSIDPHSLTCGLRVLTVFPSPPLPGALLKTEPGPYLSTPPLWQRSVSASRLCAVPLRDHRLVGGVGVGGDGFLPMPAETVSRCS
jgi:hypothetical protein